MAISFQPLPDARQNIGPSLIIAPYVCIPGTSDYVTGGYVITAASVGLTKLYGAGIWGVSAAGLSSTGFQIVAANTSTPLTQNPLTQVLLYAYVITTGVQVAASTNLSGYVTTVAFYGY